MNILIIYNDYPQSDVVHQSVFELVHSEDREELQRQLHWNSFLTPDQATIPLQVKKKTKQKNYQATIPLQVDNLSSPRLKISPFQEILLPENSHLLERSFTVRFRCLLDNTSGFLVKDMIM